MRRIEKKEELQEYIKWCKSHHKSIGFVPTMGSLHAGHVSLVRQSSLENDITIVSIFVNPAQFNNPEDLKRYPRDIDKDEALLAQVDCHVVFAPNTEDIYSTDYVPQLVDLGILDQTLEGEYRPGHFNGVVKVVQRLFQLIPSDRAYFGRKDFQQVAVIKTMVKALQIPIEIRVGDTVRDENGLALSSRNLLLTEEQKSEAVLISKVLKQMIKCSKNHAPTVCREKAILEFKGSALKLEYLEIVHPMNFNKLSKEWVPGATACVVAYCGKVRLIDNMEIISQ
jgi:pantoate--beta-alanine ligase